MNHLRAKFSGATKTYIDILWHSTILTNHSLNECSRETRTYLFYIVSTMGADALATQGARASASMIFAVLNWTDSVPWTVRVNCCLRNAERRKKEFDIDIASYGVFFMSGIFQRHRLFHKRASMNDFVPFFTCDVNLWLNILFALRAVLRW